jgi:hypothetical protein
MLGYLRLCTEPGIMRLVRATSIPAWGSAKTNEEVLAKRPKARDI